MPIHILGLQDYNLPKNRINHKHLGGCCLMRFLDGLKFWVNKMSFEFSQVKKKPNLYLSFFSTKKKALEFENIVKSFYETFFVTHLTHLQFNDVCTST